MKNVIFDLGGVLFDWDCALTFRALGGEDIDPYQPIKNGIDLLKDCTKLPHIHCFVISNWSEATLNLLWRYHKPTLDLFEGIIIPKLAGVAKPHSQIFTYFLEKYGKEPADCIFIDDLVENIESARSVGIGGIVCDDYDQVRKNLQLFLRE